MRFKANSVELSEICLKRIMAFSFFVLLLSAIFQYVKLADNMIWEDESMTWQAVQNLLDTGIPRLGPLKNSKYWVEGCNYRLYLGYLTEEILRVPIQFIGNIIGDRTFQIYTPLFYTIVLAGLSFHFVDSKEIMAHITLSNMILAFCPFLMSSYHYVRYYWFSIASTYVCFILIASILSKKHDIKISFLSILVSLVPFLFHPVGFVLFPTVLVHEIVYQIRNKELKKESKMCFLICSFVFCAFGSGVAIRTVVLNDLNLDTFNLRYGLTYLTSILASTSGRLRSIRFFAGVGIILYGLLKKEHDYASVVLKLSSTYILMLSALMPLLGTKILADRYYICSYMVFILMIAALCVHILKKSREETRQLMVVAVGGTLAMLLYKPIFTINPGYGLCEAYHSDLDKILSIDTKGIKAYVVSGDMSIIEYLPENMGYVRFRTENRVDQYEIADNGRYIQDGWCEFLGSWKTWDAYINTVNDDDIIAFFGIKTYSGDEDFNEFLQSMNAFEAPCVHTKMEYLKLQEEFMWNKSKGERQ